MLPMRRPCGLNWDWPGEDLIRVDEFREGNTQVIRAELPEIDPDKDVEITVADGMLRINAERRVEEKTQEAGYTRHEMRYGSFTRTLPLAEGATESDIKAGLQGRDSGDPGAGGGAGSDVGADEDRGLEGVTQRGDPVVGGVDDPPRPIRTSEQRWPPFVPRWCACWTQSASPTRTAAAARRRFSES